jgi:hypothetical protein
MNILGARSARQAIPGRRPFGLDLDPFLQALLLRNPFNVPDIYVTISYAKVPSVFLMTAANSK